MNDLRIPTAPPDYGWHILRWPLGLSLFAAWARVGLILTLVLGLIFGIAQQSRGAHFLSHDLCSATIAWCVSVTVYCVAFRCRLWTPVAASGAPAESVYVPMPAFD